MSMLKHADDKVAIRVGMLKNGFVITGDGVAIPVDDCERKFKSRLRLPDRYLEFELAIVRRIIEASNWEIKILYGVEFEIHY